MLSGVQSWRGQLSSLLRGILTQTKEMAEVDQAIVAQATQSTNAFTMRPKLHGRDFYRAIGEPKYIVAPMVDRSEFAWRMLTRSYLDATTSKKLLAYTPMFHARLFQENVKVRNEHFQPTKSSLETTSPPDSTTIPFLDGNPAFDRPLFVQFCANKPHELLAAAQYVAPYCDAVDLNLGCPQGIARSGKYGAFLQEDWDTIYSLINTLHRELSVPVTAKMRILDTKERTLEYAKMILSAGASILTVHGRRREQKGQNTGLADWKMIRFLRDNLPPETVLFGNGNILNGGDIEECMAATGVDGIMSAEGNLTDPTIFANPPADPHSREYWRDPKNPSVGGYRLDGVLRRYLDIIYKYVLEQEPPARKPLWVPTDGNVEPPMDMETQGASNNTSLPNIKRKKISVARMSPSLRFVQGHLFGMMKPILSTHTDIRDAIAKTSTGDLEGFENVLKMLEEKTKKELQDEAEQQQREKVSNEGSKETQKPESVEEDLTFSQRTIAKYKRPWWVAQPHLRPLPEEAIATGALKVSKKNQHKQNVQDVSTATEPAVRRSDGDELPVVNSDSNDLKPELPKSALVCG